MKNRVKIKKFTKKLDKKEFETLYALLHDASNYNAAYCARILGISTVTWNRWNTKPPKWVWWNEVLRMAVRECLANMLATRNHKTYTSKRHARIQNSLNKLPRGSQLIEEIHDMAGNYSGAEDHLRRLLSTGGMYWDQIRLPANSGGYSEQSLQVASRNLRIMKSSKGFGKDKRSKWRLRTLEDDIDEGAIKA